MQPWKDMDSTLANLNSTAGGYRMLTLQFHTQTYSDSGSYNLALKTSTQSDHRAGHQNVANMVTGNIVWLLFATPGTKPAGTYLTTVTMEGLDWELWEVVEVFGSTSKSTYTFKAPDHAFCWRTVAEGLDGSVLTCAGSVDVNAYLHYLIN